jgi:hypothetical protein
MILLEFVTAVEQVVGSGAFSEGFSALALPFHDRVFDTGRMRWRGGEIRKRHVPEPERLRDKAASLKGKADALLREADDTTC